MILSAVLGGIRQIEFIGQVFQLIRGGKDQRLQCRSVQPVLNYLAASGILDQQTIRELIEAYWFLRSLENRLQMLADKQIHQLPESIEDQQRIMASLGYQHWHELLQDLNNHRNKVQQHFENTLQEPERKTKSLIEELKPANFAEADEMIAAFKANRA